MILVGTPRSSRRRRAFTQLLVGATLITGGLVASSGRAAQAVADDDWLGIVNTYREMSGLGPVSANATWSTEAQAHSCYMLQNGISHDEDPAKAGYTPGGDIAGNSGNVAVSSATSATARSHIDLWMTGPFHAIGILRHNLTTSGFGLCAQTTTPTSWHSGGTLDVIRGIDYGIPRPSTPIVFPGDGTTTSLHSFVTEYPNPVTLCGWTGSAGLPLIAMMPNDVNSATANLTGPGGPIQTCTLHAGNTGADATARAILDGDHAVVVVPREVLADGVYTVTVNSDGGDVTWSFTVDRDAPLEASSAEPPEIKDTEPTADPTRLEPIAPFRLVDSREGKGTVRLRGGKITELTVGDPDTVAVSANFTAVRPAARGYITAYNCTTELPVVSTLGYQPGPAVANQAIVPLQDGTLCLYSDSDVDIVIDVNGYFRAPTSDGAGFQPITPSRLLDTRGASRLGAMTERRLRVTTVPGGAPGDAVAVALNITAVRTSDGGWLQAYPCNDATDRDISSVNFSRDDARPNSVLVPTDSGGEICLMSSVATDVLVDITGYFSDTGGYEFVALEPVRLVDTREPWVGLNPFTGGQKVPAEHVLRLQIAGERGVPTDAKAVSINMTAVQADRRTFMTAYPCGSRPDTSNLNLTPWQGVTANGAMVELNGSGELCIYVDQPAHVIVDINGIWR